MKISLNWLSDYIKLNGVTPEKLSETLTKAGIEVEEMVSSGTVPHGVVTAKILSREKHPNSDHLSICKVDPGTGEPIQIVCGAPNCDAGNIVPLATLGTVFKDPESGKDFQIKPSKLRGVESFGMMCSARELGLSNDHDGLMIFRADTALGQAVDAMYPGETVYSLELTQNRPDWLSHWGIARDVYALLGGELRIPTPELPEPAEKDGDFSSLVTVQAPDLCPKYTARIIRGIKVGPSPEWMQKRLAAIGIRPISNIVDITNYVMMELGVPLHTFDRSLLKDGKIIVRRAAKGESITALDGKKYDLDDSMLVICDTEKPVAIAGVMGGEYSGINDNTTEVVLEAACFDKTSIRFTSAKLNLISDASHRYERGVDIGMVERASARAAELILQLAGGMLVTPLVSVAEPAKAMPRVLCRYERIRGITGMNISDLEIAAIFSKLGLQVEPLNDTTCHVIPPTWRGDILEEADLAEEVARIHGLDKLPDCPVRAMRSGSLKDDVMLPLTHLRDALSGMGLYECICQSMIDEKSALLDTRFTKEDLLCPVNPISSDLAVMRPSLLPAMLGVVKRNISRKNLNLALYEIGNVFCANKDKFPEERNELIIMMTGQRHAERFSSELKELYDFYDLKGAVEALLEKMGILNKFRYTAVEDSRFEKGTCAELVIAGRVAGRFGQAAASLTHGMRLQTPLFFGQFDLSVILGAPHKNANCTPVSQFPPTSRDVAFIAPAELENAKVIEFITRAGVKNLESVQLVDIFIGDAIGAGRKSMAYSLSYRAADRTLTDEEVNQAHEKLRTKLEKGLGVELR